MLEGLRADELAEEGISELGFRSIESNQSEEQKENEWRK